MPRSPTPKPTEAKPKPQPPTRPVGSAAAGAAITGNHAITQSAVNTFALYLRPSLPVDVSSAQGPFMTWGAACMAAAAREQAGWGGLHATLCSFAPKLSSAAAGHHGSGLNQTALAVQQAVQARRQGGRWRLEKAAPPGANLCWCVISPTRLSPRSYVFNSRDHMYLIAEIICI